MTRRSGRLLFVLVAIASACGGDGPADLVRQTIGSDGGVITSHDGVLSIAILPGALDEPTDVEIFPSDEPPRIFGPAYRVRPNVELMVDAEVTYQRVLPADPEAAAVAAIRTEDYTDGAGEWTALPRLSLDVASDSVTATDTALSLYYGLLEEGGEPIATTGDMEGSGSGDSSGLTTPVDGSGSSDATTGAPPESTSTTSGDDSTTTDPTDPTDSSTSTTSTSTTDPTDPSSTSDDGVMAMCGDGVPAVGEVCFVAGPSSPAGNGPSDLALADFDGDTNLDVVTSNRTGGDVTVMLGLGDGTFEGPVAYIVGTSPGAIDIGDFDDDNAIDVIVANTADDTVGLLRGNGDGTLMAQVTFVVGDAPTDLVASSFGLGAADDLVVVNSVDATIQILTGGAGGVLTPSAAFDVLANSATSIVAGEFNSDGMNDAFTLGAGGAYHGWAGNNAGAFFAEVSGNFGGNFLRAASGDINGNGATDIAAVDTTADTVQIYSGTGAAAFGLVTAPNVGDAPSDVAIGDLDGNDQLEVVVANRGSDNVTVIHNLGGGTFEVALTIPVGNEPSGIRIGEVTGDGVPDVVVCDELGDTVSVVASDP